MTSIKKINANRINAKCSTGPISKKGKLNSSKNAIKHGLHAEKFVAIGAAGFELASYSLPGALNSDIF